MFGYIRATVPELRVKEHEYYKGTYCGLCHAMGKCTGQCSRLTLNYDFVMFALVRFALSGEATSFAQKRCIVHPIKKRNVMKANPELVHTSYSSALLTYHKLLDDLSDESYSKRLYTRLFLLPSAASVRKRTLKKDGYSALDKSCSEILGKLYDFEKDDTAPPSVDLPASLFGSLLGEMLAYGLDGANRRLALSIGTHLGKWIYVADALDDLEEDRKLGRFNPFLRLYEGGVLSPEQLEDVKSALKNELLGLEASLDLVDFGGDPTVKNIIYNIIYLGMPKKIEQILEKYKNDND